MAKKENFYCYILITSKCGQLMERLSKCLNMLISNVHLTSLLSGDYKFNVDVARHRER
jgi:hypothetical protein